MVNLNPWRGVLIHTLFITTQPVYLLLRYALNSTYFAQASTKWLAITVVTWLYITTRVSIPFFRSPLRKIPCAPGERFPLGHLDFNGGKLPLEKMTRACNKHADDGLFIAWSPFYVWCEIVLTRPDTLMDLMNTHNYDWEKPGAAKKFLGRITGEGLVVVEGDVHKAMRRVVAPAFAGKHVRDLTGLFYSKGMAFAKSLAKKGGEMEMMAQMSRVTLDIIGAAGVGKDFNTIENDKDPLARLYAIITDTHRGHLFVAFMMDTLIPPWIMRKLGNSVHAKIARAQHQLRQDAVVLMQEKKQMMAEKTIEQKDIISIIMRSGDYPDDYLVNQLMTFLAAGHDTTASALTWTIMLLCQHPEAQERLRAECNTHLSHKSPTEIDATTFETENMPYLSAICSEVLRLYATVPFTARDSIRPTRLGKYHIPAGVRAVMSPWAINRNVALWGADAAKFVPERWMDGPNAANGGAVSPYALITFLHGPRSCIGQSFARLEMKCILAALVMQLRFEMVDPNEEIEVGGFITIKPLNGLRVRLHDVKVESAMKT